MLNPFTTNRSLIIAVDFDGTLVDHVFPGMGAPRISTIDKVKELKARGHRLILWTCREGEALLDAVRFCTAMGLTFEAVNENIPNPEYAFPTSHKVYADLYLDDKGLDVELFDQLQE